MAEPDLVEWVAPIRLISDDGTVMMQERTTPLTEKDLKKIPDSIPVWLNDVHIQSIGMLNGKVVFHDFTDWDEVGLETILNKKRKIKSVR